MLYLKEILKEKHMTADQLAALTGLSKTQIWHYAAGRRNPDVSALVAMADALDVSLDRLIRGKEKTPSPENREGLEKANATHRRHGDRALFPRYLCGIVKERQEGVLERSRVSHRSVRRRLFC